MVCVASLGDHLLVQVTKMYEDAVRERDSVVTRLARMDGERRELIDAKEEGAKRARDLSKVHTYIRCTHALYVCTSVGLRSFNACVHQYCIGLLAPTTHSPHAS